MVGRIRRGFIGGLLLASSSVAAAATVAVIAPATAAFADPYGPTFTCTISVSPSTIALGGQFHVQLKCTGGSKPGDTFTITFGTQQTVLGTITINNGGVGNGTFTDPTQDGTGVKSVTATDSSGYSVSTSITVTQKASTAAATGSASNSDPPAANATLTSANSSKSGLAFTGADAAGTAAGGAVLIGVGGAVVLASRRRRSAAQS